MDAHKRKSTRCAPDADVEMKEGATHTQTKRPRFPYAYMGKPIFLEAEEDAAFIVRNNAAYVSSWRGATLFTRPTQLGKTTLLKLGHLAYSRNYRDVPSAAPVAATVATDFLRNRGFVITFDFLGAVAVSTGDGWEDALRANDLKLLRTVQHTVQDFIANEAELQPCYEAPHEGSDAGEYLKALARAVKHYKIKSNDPHAFLMILVDEYDKPLADVLFDMLFPDQRSDKPFSAEDIRKVCGHYVSFFTACKMILQDMATPNNQIWLTGVSPIALDLLCGFKPRNVTFEKTMADGVGLLDQDVAHMLDKVHAFLPFSSVEEKAEVHQAIRDHANHLRFLGAPIYHTRMVNELMTLLCDDTNRQAWIRNLSILPAGVTLEGAPRGLFSVIKSSAACRSVAKELAKNVDVHGNINARLDLPAVMAGELTKDNYLTLLVHLGIVSVVENEDSRDSCNQHTFRATSRHFRSKYLGELFKVTLLPLLQYKTPKEVYHHKNLLEEFMNSLPTSGMSKMIKWASSRSSNRTLELQFQGNLIGELHEHFLESEDIFSTQEDKTDSGRTDVRIHNQRDKTMVILELKQKPTSAPTANEMKKHHEQLNGYMEEVSASKGIETLSGFVVVMYNGGSQFRIEPSTFEP